ncbi:hypothetical protein ABW02_23335 [Niallia circulans]|uniref:DUF559 domain-containing protein n=2 Tax=Niallia TaxID=2837506 RepID=A0A0J1KVC3_NIACI|nr:MULTISPECIES: DUF559 domain-containing protein [Bacillaceae]KAB7665695.1 DUF559 domain-containing protein [Bacillus sp. B1-b2]KLV20665.1 hypothetical protein ABW02_23335 [Niallia circulans]MCF2650080.1 DUF559 domain-containing protein [Niallia circulans]CAI9394473.1 hypothetical protein BACSP_03756 [Bacillus sp. T2.9-1]
MRSLIILLISRKQMERRFGEILKNSLEGIVYIYDKYRVDNYIVDFYIPQLELVIEYDEKHHKKQIKDDN